MAAITTEVSLSIAPLPDSVNAMLVPGVGLTRLAPTKVVGNHAVAAGKLDSKKVGEIVADAKKLLK